MNNLEKVLSILSECDGKCDGKCSCGEKCKCKKKKYKDEEDYDPKGRLTKKGYNKLIDKADYSQER